MKRGHSLPARRRVEVGHVRGRELQGLGEPGEGLLARRLALAALQRADTLGAQARLGVSIAGL
jgi:hypothetical protein